jgi:hypothetical protein
MRSITKETTEGIDLERDLQLTTADIDALARARKGRSLDFEKYLQWLDEFTAGRTRRRKSPSTDFPFEL